MPTRLRSIGWLAALLLLTALIYWPGLRGGYLFDDSPNIVDNHALQITHLDYQSLKSAALSSPSSGLKRPLAYLSFSLNYYFTGLAPGPMKAVNLIIHLLNALLVYAVLLALLRWRDAWSNAIPQASTRNHLFALAITAAWALAPINLTSVLYVVQRMESLCNLFVLAGLWAYIAGRERQAVGRGGWWWIAAGLLGGTGLGLLAKESALLLPLYIMLLEWALLRWRCADRRSSRVLRGLHASMFALGTLATAFMLPRLVAPSTWSIRAFTLGQRLLTEPRVLWSYIDWTLLPNLSRLGFYYDDYSVSTGLLSPPSTVYALLGLLGLAIAAIVLRRRVPLASLGIAWFLAAHVMTGSVIPLELVFEHRNYFASFALLLALLSIAAAALTRPSWRRIALPLLIAWIAWLGFVTALRVQEWQNPLRLAQSLAAKQPQSPRTQYELGRTYLVLSNYDPASPFTAASRHILEHASTLPGASPLAEQALLMQSAHLQQPEDPAWWSQLETKLRQRPVGPQEVQSLYSLVHCTIIGDCRFAPTHMQAALRAALAHPSPEVLAIYANYALNVLHDATLALSLTRESIRLGPGDPKYRENLILLLVTTGQTEAARAEMGVLQKMIGNDELSIWVRATLTPLKVDLRPTPGDSN